MDVLQRHLPRVAEALRNALEYLSAVATLVFGEPPPPTVSPEADSKTSPQPAEVDYDRAEEALWTVSLPDEANDHQAEDSFSCMKVSTDALDLSAPRSRVTLRRVSSAKRQSSAGSQTRSITKASLEESLTDLLPDVQSSTEPPRGSISEICLEDALQQVSIHLEGSERPQHNGTEETGVEDSHAGVSTQNRSWAEPHYESTSEASLEESIWSQLACRQSSAKPQAGDIGDACPKESHVGLSNQRQRSAEPHPGDIDETCLKGAHEDLSSQSQRVSELQLGDIDEICLAESRAVLSNKQQRLAEPQPVGDIDETCLKGSHEDLSTQSQTFLELQPGDIEVSCIPESHVGLSMQTPRLSELLSGNIDDNCLVELNEDLYVQGQSSAGSLPGDVKNAALEKESFHVDPAGVSLSTFYYSITEPKAEWCPQTQEDGIDEGEVEDEVLNLTGDLLQEMKEYLQAPLMGSWEKDETSSAGHEEESQEEEENDQPQDMVNMERSRDWEVKEREEEEEKQGWPAETVQEKSGVELGENEKENPHWRSATITEAEGREEESVETTRDEKEQEQERTDCRASIAVQEQVREEKPTDGQYEDIAEEGQCSTDMITEEQGGREKESEEMFINKEVLERGMNMFPMIIQKLATEKQPKAISMYDQFQQQDIGHFSSIVTDQDLEEAKTKEQEEMANDDLFQVQGWKIIEQEEATTEEQIKMEVCDKLEKEHGMGQSLRVDVKKLEEDIKWTQKDILTDDEGSTCRVDHQEQEEKTIWKKQEELEDVEATQNEPMNTQVEGIKGEEEKEEEVTSQAEPEEVQEDEREEGGEEGTPQKEQGDLPNNEENENSSLKESGEDNEGWKERGEVNGAEEISQKHPGDAWEVAEERQEEEGQTSPIGQAVLLEKRVEEAEEEITQKQCSDLHKDEKEIKISWRYQSDLQENDRKAEDEEIFHLDQAESEMVNKEEESYKNEFGPVLDYAGDTKSWKELSNFQAETDHQTLQKELSANPKKEEEGSVSQMESGYLEGEVEGGNKEVKTSQMNSNYPWEELGEEPIEGISHYEEEEKEEEPENSQSEQGVLHVNEGGEEMFQAEKDDLQEEDRKDVPYQKEHGSSQEGDSGKESSQEEPIDSQKKEVGEDVETSHEEQGGQTQKIDEGGENEEKISHKELSDLQKNDVIAEKSEAQHEIELVDLQKMKQEEEMLQEEPDDTQDDEYEGMSEKKPDYQEQTIVKKEVLEEEASEIVQMDLHEEEEENVSYQKEQIDLNEKVDSEEREIEISQKEQDALNVYKVEEQRSQDEKIIPDEMQMEERESETQKEPDDQHKNTSEEKEELCQKKPLYLRAGEEAVEEGPTHHEELCIIKEIKSKAEEEKKKVSQWESVDLQQEENEMFQEIMDTAMKERLQREFEIDVEPSHEEKGGRTQKIDEGGENEEEISQKEHSGLQENDANVEKSEAKSEIELADLQGMEQEYKMLQKEPDDSQEEEYEGLSKKKHDYQQQMIEKKEEPEEEASEMVQMNLHKEKENVSFEKEKSDLNEEKENQEERVIEISQKEQDDLLVDKVEEQRSQDEEIVPDEVQMEERGGETCQKKTDDQHQNKSEEKKELCQEKQLYLQAGEGIVEDGATDQGELGIVNENEGKTEEDKKKISQWESVDLQHEEKKMFQVIMDTAMKDRLQREFEIEEAAENVEPSHEEQGGQTQKIDEGEENEEEISQKEHSDLPENDANVEKSDATSEIELHDLQEMEQEEIMLLEEPYNTQEEEYEGLSEQKPNFQQQMTEKKEEPEEEVSGMVQMNLHEEEEENVSYQKEQSDLNENKENEEERVIGKSQKEQDGLHVDKVEERKSQDEKIIPDEMQMEERARETQKEPDDQHKNSSEEKEELCQEKPLHLQEGEEAVDEGPTHHEELGIRKENKGKAEEDKKKVSQWESIDLQHEENEMFQGIMDTVMKDQLQRESEIEEAGEDVEPSREEQGDQTQKIDEGGENEEEISQKEHSDIQENDANVEKSEAKCEIELADLQGMEQEYKMLQEEPDDSQKEEYEGLTKKKHDYQQQMIEKKEEPEEEVSEMVQMNLHKEKENVSYEKEKSDLNEEKENQEERVIEISQKEQDDLLVDKEEEQRSQDEKIVPDEVQVKEREGETCQKKTDDQYPNKSEEKEELCQEKQLYLQEGMGIVQEGATHQEELGIINENTGKTEEEKKKISQWESVDLQHEENEMFQVIMDTVMKDRLQREFEIEEAAEDVEPSHVEQAGETQKIDEGGDNEEEISQKEQSDLQENDGNVEKSEAKSEIELADLQGIEQEEEMLLEEPYNTQEVEYEGMSEKKPDYQQQMIEKKEEPEEESSEMIQRTLHEEEEENVSYQKEQSNLIENKEERVIEISQKEQDVLHMDKVEERSSQDEIIIPDEMQMGEREVETQKELDGQNQNISEEKEELCQEKHLYLQAGEGAVEEGATYQEELGIIKENKGKAEEEKKKVSQWEAVALQQEENEIFQGIMDTVLKDRLQREFGLEEIGEDVEPSREEQGGETQKIDEGGENEEEISQKEQSDLQENDGNVEKSEAKSEIELADLQGIEQDEEMLLEEPYNTQEVEYEGMSEKKPDYQQPMIENKEESSEMVQMTPHEEEEENVSYQKEQSDLIENKEERVIEISQKEQDGLHMDKVEERSSQDEIIIPDEMQMGEREVETQKELDGQNQNINEEKEELWQEKHLYLQAGEGAVEEGATYQEELGIIKENKGKAEEEKKKVSQWESVDLQHEENEMFQVIMETVLKDRLQGEFGLEEETPEGNMSFRNTISDEERIEGEIPPRHTLSEEGQVKGKTSPNLTISESGRVEGETFLRYITSEEKKVEGELSLSVSISEERRIEGGITTRLSISESGGAEGENQGETPLAEWEEEGESYLKKLQHPSQAQVEYEVEFQGGPDHLQQEEDGEEKITSIVPPYVTPQLTFEEEAIAAPEGHLPFPEASVEEDQLLLPMACLPPVKRDMIGPTEAVHPSQEGKGQIALSIQDHKNDGKQEVRLEQDMESPSDELKEKYQNDIADGQEEKDHLIPLLKSMEYPLINRENTQLTAQGEEPIQDQYKIEGASSTTCLKHSENVEETEAGEAHLHVKKEDDATLVPISTQIHVLPSDLGPEEQWGPAQPLHDRHSFKRKSIRQKQGKKEEFSHSQRREMESPPDELKEKYQTDIADGQEKKDQLISLLKPVGYPLRNEEKTQLTDQGGEPLQDQYKIEGESSTTCLKHSENVEEAQTGEAHLHAEKEDDTTQKSTSTQIRVLPNILGPEEQWEPAQPLQDRHSFKRKSIRQKQGKKEEPTESSHSQEREIPVGEAVSVTLDKVDENEDETDALFRMGDVQTLDVSAQKDRVHLRRKVSVRRRQGLSSRPQSIREAPTETPEPADLFQPIGEVPIKQVEHAASMWPVRETGGESQSHVGSGEDLHPQPPVVQRKPLLLPGMVPMMMPGMMPGMVRPPRPQPAPPAVEDSAIEDSTTKKAEEIKPKKKLPGHAGFGFAHPQMMQELQFRLRKPKPQ